MPYGKSVGYFRFDTSAGLILAGFLFLGNHPFPARKIMRQRCRWTEGVCRLYNGVNVAVPGTVFVRVRPSISFPLPTSTPVPRDRARHQGDIMKTNLLFLALVVLALLTGCATPAEVYDTSVPAENLCTLKIVSAITVTQFDGAAVNWAAPGLSTWKKIQIPSGTHEFVMDYYRTQNGLEWRGNNLTASYPNFRAGRTYQLILAVAEEFLMFRLMEGKNVGSGKTVVVGGTIDAPNNEGAFLIFLKDVTK
jgi:hypothetical protein